MLEVMSLKAYLTVKKIDSKEGLGALLRCVEAFDRTALTEIIQGGVLYAFGTQGPKDCIFLPQGWILVEKAAAEKKTHYGVRKSFMIGTEKSATDYELCLQLIRDAGKHTQRMDAILECLSAHAAAASAEPIVAQAPVQEG